MEYFDHILGHAAAKEVLAKAVASPRHGYLITGAAGAGAHTVAEAFVRALVGGEGSRPLSAHPDVAVLAREWNDAGTALKKEIAVREVRALRMRVAERPVASSRVVAYIPDADALNEEGVNALLKSVEEPSAGAVFVLVAYRPGNLPATLRSRLQTLALHRVPSNDIRAWLASRGIAPADINAAVLAADGRPGIALRFISDADYRARIAEAEETIAAIVRARGSGDAFAAIAAASSRSDAADDPVLEWQETLHLWGGALRRRIGMDPPEVLAGIGHALLAAERFVGGPISPRLILELGLNRVASGHAPVFPGWTRGAYPYPIGN